MPGGALLANVKHRMAHRAIPALLVWPLAACFYTDGVNNGPIAKISDPPQLVYVGMPLNFTSKSSDADGQALQLQWFAAECTDDLSDCDDPFASGTQEAFSFTYPWSKRA